MTLNLSTRGIISVLQTPFLKNGHLDEQSLVRLVNDAITAGVDGFLVPVVASEVAALTEDERRRIVDLVAEETNQRVPIIVGASADDPEVCATLSNQCEEISAAACLVAVPEKLYTHPSKILPFFEKFTNRIKTPLIIQDLQFGGPGMDLETICKLRDAIPTLVGLKIETVPAGPKYTAVRNKFGSDFFIAGGWAVTQMIEALDRGVDAMMPESAMIRVYKAIDNAYQRGDRLKAGEIFNRLIPVLAFTNQELITSIVFFKRLLVRKSIFKCESIRVKKFEWDAFNTRIADELIETYLQLEKDVQDDL